MRYCRKLLARAALGAAVLAVAACGDVGIGGDDDDGSSIRYAESGTEIELANVVDGTVSSAVITVAAASGAEGGYVSADGRAGTFYPGCWGCGGEMEIDGAAYGALWPLSPGKTASFVRTAPDGTTAEVTIRVVGRERIEIPAGTYETYILSGTIEANSGEPWSASMRSWWSPELGWVIKSEGSDSTGMALSSRIVRIEPPE